MMNADIGRSSRWVGRAYTAAHGAGPRLPSSSWFPRNATRDDRSGGGAGQALYEAAAVSGQRSKMKYGSRATVVRTPQ